MIALYHIRAACMSALNLLLLPFIMMNTDFSYLLVWRVITFHQGAELRSELAVRLSLSRVVKWRFWPRHTRPSSLLVP